MNIFLIVFLSIVILLLFILILPLEINFIYNSEEEEKIKLNLEILFFKFNFIHKTKQNKIKKERSKNKKKEKRKKEKNIKNLNKNENININEDKEKKEKKNINDYYILIKQLYNISSPIIKKLFSHINVKNIEIYYIISGEDSAEIGIKYGRINIIIYNIYNILKQLLNIKKSKIYIYPDFVNNKTKTCFKLNIRFVLLNILLILLFLFIKLGVYYIKTIKKDRTVINNE